MIWTILIVRCIVVNLMIVMIQNQTAFSSSMLLFTYTTWKKNIHHLQIMIIIIFTYTTWAYTTYTKYTNYTTWEARTQKYWNRQKKIKFGWWVPKHGEKKNFYNNDVDQPEWWSPPSRCWWDRGWGRRRQGWARVVKCHRYGIEIYLCKHRKNK